MGRDEEKNEGPNMHDRVISKDRTLRVKENSPHPKESGLLGLKEISIMNAARVKRKESSFPNRRARERRNIGHSD